MKFFSALIFVLLFTSLSHSAYNDIVYGKSIDQSVQNGTQFLLPGWNWLTKDFKTVAITNNGVGTISLEEGFHITYMGKTYNSLSVYPNGSIAFGDYSEDLTLFQHPFVQPIKESISLKNTSAKWKSFTDENSFDRLKKNRYVGYTVVELGPFYLFGTRAFIQVWFYTDGEVQVQLWSANEKVLSSKATLIPSVYNGVKWQMLEDSIPKNISLFSNGSLRPGWIAKGFIGTKSLIAGVEVVNGQLAFDMGVESYAGALLAFDYSREHPVVGSFSNVKVNLDVNPDNFTQKGTLVFWPFGEKKASMESYFPYLSKNTTTVIDGQIPAFTYNYYYRENDLATYSWNTSSASKTGTNVEFSMDMKSNFDYTWYSLFNVDKVDNENIQFHSAPAFKFQLNNAGDMNTILRFDSITYTLAQRPAYRFIPPTADFTFTTSFANNGRIDVDNMEGGSPYHVYKDQNVRAMIRASVGNEIKSVSINGTIVFENGARKDGVDPELSKMIQVAGYDTKEVLAFDSDIRQNISLHVEFGPCSGRKLELVTPAMVRVTNFRDPESSTARKNSSAVIKGSFGETVQKQGLLENGKYVVSAYYTDDYGQKNYSTSDFVRDANDFEYQDMACKGCIIAANNYYDGSESFDRPNAQGVAYVEYDKRYGNEFGSNGTSFGIADASRDNYPDQAESWTIPVFSENDFISENVLNTSSIQNKFMNSHKKNDYAGFFLTISRDAEGRFQQSISDNKGLLRATRRTLGGKVHTVKYSYNSLDQLESIIPDGNKYLATTYEYDAKGRVVKTKSPDRGEVETVYDSHDRARYVRNSAQKHNKTFSAKIYDDQGRDIASVEVTNEGLFSNPDATLNASDYKLYNRTVYGKPTEQELRNLGLSADANLLNQIFSSMENIRDKDVGATLAYDADGNVSVVKMASYDRIGRKNRQWIIYAMAGMPAVQLTYEYNSADELTNSSFDEWNGSGFVSKAKRERYYDHKGRLTSIKDENGKLIADYVYTANGNVKSKSYYDRGELVYKKTILRDVHGRPTSIRYENGSKLIYSDNLEYGSPLAGRVSKAEHEWKDAKNDGDESSSGEYTYDEDGRLTKVDGTLPGEYRYGGPQGQMDLKREGNDYVAMSYTNYDSYRPSGYNVNGGSPAASAEYFKYDDAGNVWYDRRAKSAYRLNAAGLPEIAYILIDEQNDLTLDQVNAGNVNDIAETMRMAYDETGNRVWTGFQGAGIDYEVAEMPGVGTYEWTHVGTGATGFSLKRMDLVAGGFRDVKKDVAYFPVVDAQGNVRGYATKDGLQSIYDYYAYGTAVELVHGTEDDNKRWQGKEYDEPIRKLYFGSRYFDPFFGMWMSPDPAGQFANPYTYGGDPLNYVDPNGEWVHIVVGAVIGAVVGTVNGAIQCTAPGAGSSCTKSVTTGFVGGAAVGAAAAATGGAAAEAVGAGLGGAIAGGAAGGAVGGLGNYATNAFVSGSGVSWGGAWDATWKGAAAGAIGGAAGSVAGNYMAYSYAQLVGGFAGGASGSALNEGFGWNILLGGLMGAAMAHVSDVADTYFGDHTLYSVVYDNEYIENDAENIGHAVAYENETPSKIQQSVFEEFEGLAPEGREVFRLYDKNGKFVKGSESFSTEPEEGFVSGKKATITKTKLTTEAVKFMKGKTGWHAIHNHPTNRYPSTGLLSPSSNVLIGDARIAQLYPTGNHYVYQKNDNSWLRYFVGSDNIVHHRYQYW